MKASGAIAVVIGMLLQTKSLPGGERAVPLSADTLSQWSVTGEALFGADSRQSLVLQKRSELTRQFAEEVIGIDLSSRPVFGLEPEAWPVVEVGSVAVIFAREGEEGTVFLREAGGGLVPSRKIALDSQGRSEEALEVELRHLPGGVTLSVAGEVVFLPGEAAPAESVVISAGAQNPWPLERVRVVVQEAALESTAVGASASESNGAQASIQSNAALGGSAVVLAAKAPAAPSSASSEGSSGSVEESSLVLTLEVFTPPSVRTRSVTSPGG